MQVLGQGNSSQNADDRHNDHQLDQGEGFGTAAPLALRKLHQQLGLKGCLGTPLNSSHEKNQNVVSSLSSSLSSRWQGFGENLLKS